MLGRTTSASLALVLALCCTLAAVADAPRNVIICIGDGMGFEQVKAAGMYENGAPGTLPFESLPYTAECMTYSANSSVTDSAASGTAIATGHKVNNGVVSRAFPGNGAELTTLLEHAQGLGKRTGLVTTTYMTHATPATFAAHESSRNNLTQIAGDYLNQTRPNVLLGGGAHGMSPAASAAAGYTAVTNRSGLLALDTNAETMVSGLFGSSHLPYEYDYATGSDHGYDTLPHLSEMTSVALDILDNDADGFFLMVEGGRIDHAGHDNNIQRNIYETIEFSNTVADLLAWAQGRDDTLVIVTADHETGGLSVLQNNGQGNFPSVHWSSTNHTAANVPVYAWGANADLVSGVMDNTDFFEVVTTPEPSTALAMLVCALICGGARRSCRGIRT